MTREERLVHHAFRFMCRIRRLEAENDKLANELEDLREHLKDEPQRKRPSQAASPGVLPGAGQGQVRENTEPPPLNPTGDHNAYRCRSAGDTPAGASEGTEPGDPPEGRERRGGGRPSPLPPLDLPEGGPVEEDKEDPSLGLPPIDAFGSFHGWMTPGDARDVESAWKAAGGVFRLLPDVTSPASPDDGRDVTKEGG